MVHAIAVHLGPKYITIPLIEDAEKDSEKRLSTLFHSSVFGCYSWNPYRSFALKISVWLGVDMIGD